MKQINSNNSILFHFYSVPSNATSEILQSAKELVGCPDEYNWCTTTPQIKLSQFIIGMVFLSIGYPFILVMTTTIYSKILGPKPQVRRISKWLIQRRRTSPLTFLGNHFDLVCLKSVLYHSYYLFQGKIFYMYLVIHVEILFTFACVFL